MIDDAGYWLLVETVVTFFLRKQQRIMHCNFLILLYPHGFQSVLCFYRLPSALALFEGGLRGSSATLFEDFKFKGCCSEQPPLGTMPWEFRKNPCTEKSTTYNSTKRCNRHIKYLVNCVSTGYYIESSSLACFVWFWHEFLNSTLSAR